MTESRVRDIPSDQDFYMSVKQAAEAQTKIVVDFTASWYAAVCLFYSQFRCGPCKAIAPVFKALSAQYPEIQVDSPTLVLVLTVSSGEWMAINARYLRMARLFFHLC